MNRRVNRRYQTPLPPDFVHFLVEEQGLSERQKAVVYQLRNKMQDSEWHYQDAKMSKDEFEETVKDLNDYYWRLLVSLALSAFEAQKRNRVLDPQGIR
nr:MAG TPA: hypothetical protein [Caudoviricetes sp.]